MVEEIELPVPQLSLLKKVHVDLDMTGEHFERLALFDGKQPERLALSIVRDLCEEDASLLTVTEVNYLFHLIKVHSTQEEITAEFKCPDCGTIGSYTISLDQATLRVPSPDFKVPTVSLRLSPDTPAHIYRVLPVTMSRLVSIQDWFMSVRNVDLTKPETPKGERYLHGLVQAFSCLYRDDDSQVLDPSNYASVADIAKANTFSEVKKLLLAEAEVSSFGPRLDVIYPTCKECGKSHPFRVSILFGVDLSSNHFPQ